MIFYDRGEYREDRLSLAVDSPAFRYGFGFFETVFWDGTGACRLGLHLERLGASMAAFGLPYAPGDLPPAIETVARRNGLAGITARVNIIIPVDGPGPYRPVITAHAYTPPPMDRALDFSLSPRPLHAWLGAFKSANYLHYHLEHRAALNAGLDGAAIAAPGGWLLEAAHATLVFSMNNALVTPAPPSIGKNSATSVAAAANNVADTTQESSVEDRSHQTCSTKKNSGIASNNGTTAIEETYDFDETAPGMLPGTALAAAREVLDIPARPIHLDELPAFDHAWALNSLMGMRCVSRVGDVSFAPDTAPITAAEAHIRKR